MKNRINLAILVLIVLMGCKSSDKSNLQLNLISGCLNDVKVSTFLPCMASEITKDDLAQKILFFLGDTEEFEEPNKYLRENYGILIMNHGDDAEKLALGFWLKQMNKHFHKFKGAVFPELNDKTTLSYILKVYGNNYKVGHFGGGDFGGIMLIYKNIANDLDIEFMFERIKFREAEQELLSDNKNSKLIYIQISTKKNLTTPNKKTYKNTCDKCGGTGRCNTCGGDGTINCPSHDTDGNGYCTDCNNSGFTVCFACNGNGRCKKCNGSGDY